MNQIRSRKPATDDLVDKMIRQVMTLAAIMLREHLRVVRMPSFETLQHSYIFRHALCAHIWLLDWIESGSPSGRKVAKTRNDLVDLHFATYATYFDGLLTKDRRLDGIHALAKRMLIAFATAR